MNIILYTTYCPKCKVLESKLNSKGLKYTIVDNEEEVISFGEKCGIMSAPILDYNGDILDFTQAIKKINNI